MAGAGAGVDAGGAPNENAGAVTGLGISTVVAGTSLGVDEGAKEGRLPKSEGGAAGFASSLDSAKSAGDGAGGAIVTPGLVNTDEVAKKLGIVDVVALAAVAVSAAGFVGAGLGGMSEIDGTNGVTLAGVAGAGSEALTVRVSVVAWSDSGTGGGVFGG